MSHLFAQADAARLPLADASVDLVVGSPPYCAARLYLEDGKDLGIARGTAAWVDWMLTVTEEALRVTKGAVIWVCAGVTRDRNYQPACEGLLWEAYRRGISSCRPVYWHRSGVPGCGGDDWFRADVEYCFCFKRPGGLPWSDNTACGHPPKWAPGGEMSNRIADGARVNQWGSRNKSSSGARLADGRLKPRKSIEAGNAATSDAIGYKAPVLANPGNLFSTGTAGGGTLGHPIAHENEAPYPEAVPEFFIKSLAKPGGIVVDPFSGSGTTVSVAARLGRRGIGFDLRMSQCKLGVQRLERPHAPVVKKSAADRPLPLFGV